MKAYLLFTGIFAGAYTLLLAVGLGLGFLVLQQTGYNQKLFDNIGFGVNLLSFAGAVSISNYLTRRVLIPIRHLRQHISQQVAPSRRWLLAITFALLGVVIDRLYHAAASSYFTGEVAELGTLRLLGLAAAYVWFAHFVLGQRGKHELTSPQDAARAGALLLREFQALSTGDKSVLINALRTAEPVMMTSKGSPNDCFWQKLAQRGWMEKTKLPEAIAQSPKGRDFVTWTVTPIGRLHIAELLRAAL